MPDLLIRIRGDAGNTEKVLKDVGTSAGGMGKMLGGVTSSLGGLVSGLGSIGLAAGGITAITGAIGGMASGMLSGNAEMERYETQLGTLMGSSDAAKERLAELAAFGASTPFELPEIARAEKVLLGFGLAGEKAKELTGRSFSDLRTILGDVAAGTGAQFEEIALTMGKFSAGATGEAISRFQELGIATREQMGELGVQFSKSGELMSPLPVAMEAVTTLMQQKFGGGMQKLSMTFEGQMSTLSDTFNMAKVTLMAPIFDVMSGSLVKLNEFLSSDVAQSALKDIAHIVGRVITVALDLGGKAFTELMPIIERLGAIATKVFAGDITGAFTALIDHQTETGGRILELLGEWGTAFVAWVGPMIPPLLAELGKLAGEAVQWIVNEAPILLQELEKWGRSMIAWVQPMIPPLLKELGVMATNFLDWVGKQAPPLLEKLIGEWIPQFIGFVVQLNVDILRALPGFLVTLGGWIQEVAPKVGETALLLGGAIVRGLIKGATDLGPQLWAAITGLAGDAINAAKRALGIASPSKEFEEIGGNIIEGLVWGLEGKREAMIAYISRITGEAVEAAQEAMQEVAAVMSGGGGGGWNAVSSGALAEAMAGFQEATIGSNGMLDAFVNGTQAGMFTEAPPMPYKPGENERNLGGGLSSIILNVDGRQLAQAIEPLITAEQDRNNSRRGGV